MTFIASPLAYTTAAFLATLMLTDLSRADSAVLTAQASPTPAPATTTKQVPGPAAERSLRPTIPSRPASPNYMPSSPSLRHRKTFGVMSPK